MGKKGTKSSAEDKDKPDALGKADYEDRLEPLQLELNNLARWLQHTGKRWWWCSKAATRRARAASSRPSPKRLNPRQCHVVALGKPSDARAHAVVFPALRAAPAGGRRDRAVRPQLVQPRRRRARDGILQREQVAAFLKQAPVFEKMLVDDGILLLKYWLTVDQAQQEERFAERAADPLKRWKLSPIDLRRAHQVRRLHQGARTPCWRPRTPGMRPGRWSTSTTSAAAG